jgi:hypothetical protein
MFVYGIDIIIGVHCPSVYNGVGKVVDYSWQICVFSVQNIFKLYQLQVIF